MKRDSSITAFYNSVAWKQCREAYKTSVGGICEICYKKGIISPGEIVHHKRHVTPRSVNDPNVTLAFKNLICVCRKCHAEEHGEMYGHTSRRYRVDENGHVVSVGP